MTLEEALLEFGFHADQINPEGYECPCCGQTSRAWAMSSDADITDVRCTTCAIDLAREKQAIAEAHELERLAKEEPWATPCGLELKAERNRRIDAARWAVDPLTSPLTPSSQSQFAEYIRTLNRLTVDFEGPAEVVWPELPTQEFPTT